MFKKVALTLMVFCVGTAALWETRQHWRDVLPPGVRSTFVSIREATIPGGEGAAPKFDAIKTRSYIESLDVTRLAEKGATFADFKISEWEGVKLSQEEITYSYDLESLQQLANRLEGVDRYRVLESVFRQITSEHETEGHFFSGVLIWFHDLFNRLTGGASIKKQQFLKVVAFLQKASFHHPYRQPTFAEKQTVLDPLILLELNEMRCSQVSFVGTDILRAGGFKARSVQLGGHVIGEAYFDGDWHYYDADLFSNGTLYRDDEGQIPSVVELSHSPKWIDSLPPTFENVCCGGPVGSVRYPSFYYFNKAAYGAVQPMYYEKKLPPGKESGQVYGWNRLEKVIDKKRVLVETPGKYQPAPPSFKSVNIDRSAKQIILEWNESYDGDNDLAGYQVFVSKTGRGWNFPRVGDHPMANFLSFYGPWDVAQYDKLGQLPKAEIADIFTTATKVAIPVPSNGDFYITVMAKDKYGEEIGRKLYHLSEELVVKID